MISFLLGFACGSVVTVVSPAAYRWVSNRVARAKDKLQDFE
jgi:hypothetical protein